MKTIVKYCLESEAGNKRYLTETFEGHLNNITIYKKLADKNPYYANKGLMFVNEIKRA